MYTDPKSEKMDEVQGRAEIIVGKQRNGPIDDIALAFVGRYARFENLSIANFENMPVGPEEQPF
jgi:replicative DNA helicase